MTGTRQVMQDPWGARVHDWAEIEDENSRPLFESVFDLTELGEGQRLLDVGCGAGLACAIATARGAMPSGVDASPGMLAAARGRVPDGDFRESDMTSLPFEADAFDLVTFFNTIFFATDPQAAVGEAARVARRGGTVAVVAWPEPGKVELAAYLAALGPLMPPGPELNPFIATPELKRMALSVGLEPKRVVELDWSWAYPDRETALRGLLSPGPSAIAVESVGEEAVREAIIAALEPYRLASGGYRIENLVHCLIALA